MDFQISCGSGKAGRCPECNRKYMAMIVEGVKKVVCSCGWTKILHRYPQNSVNPEDISKG